MLASRQVICGADNETSFSVFPVLEKKSAKRFAFQTMGNELKGVAVAKKLDGMITLDAGVVK